LNKEHLPYFAVILILLPMFSLIVVGAENNNQENSLEYQNVTTNEAYKMVISNAFVSSDKVFILDVRTPAEYNYTHIEGANLIPLRNVPLHDHVNLSDEGLLAWHIKNNKDLPKTKMQKYLFTALVEKEVLLQVKCWCNQVTKESIICKAVSQNG
jgi:hypothetical protein